MIQPTAVVTSFVMILKYCRTASNVAPRCAPPLADDDGQQDAAEELEVTGEGTAGGPFGLKKVLFVRKKSDKNITSKEVRLPSVLLFLLCVAVRARCQYGYSVNIFSVQQSIRTMM